MRFSLDFENVAPSSSFLSLEEEFFRSKKRQRTSRTPPKNNSKEVVTRGATGVHIEGGVSSTASLWTENSQQTATKPIFASSTTTTKSPTFAFGAFAPASLSNKQIDQDFVTAAFPVPKKNTDTEFLSSFPKPFPSPPTFRLDLKKNGQQEFPVRKCLTARKPRQKHPHIIPGEQPSKVMPATDPIKRCNRSLALVCQSENFGNVTAFPDTEAPTMSSPAKKTSNGTPTPNRGSPSPKKRKRNSKWYKSAPNLENQLAITQQRLQRSEDEKRKLGVLVILQKQNIKEKDRELRKCREELAVVRGSVQVLETALGDQEALVKEMKYQLMEADKLRLKDNDTGKVLMLTLKGHNSSKIHQADPNQKKTPATRQKRKPKATSACAVPVRRSKRLASKENGME